MNFSKCNLYAATLAMLVLGVASGQAQTVKTVRPKVSCSQALDKPGPLGPAFAYIRPAYSTASTATNPYEFSYRSYTCEGLPKNTEVKGWIQGDFQSFPIPGSDTRKIAYVALAASFSSDNSRVGSFSACHDTKANCGGDRSDADYAEFQNLAGLSDVVEGQLPVGTNGWQMNYAKKALGKTDSHGSVTLLVFAQIAVAKDANNSHDQHDTHTISALKNARVCIIAKERDTVVGDSWCSRSEANKKKN